MVLNTDQNSTQIQKFDTSIRAIAHPLRRQILVWLKDPQLYFPEQAYGQNFGVCFGQVTLRCSLSQSTVSVHMDSLKRAGLIDLNKHGNVHFYKRNENAIQSFKELLTSHLQGEGF
ncbi:MAG TPA: helix-turn-helix transcriptional regulator [Pseudomonas sp.]|jgi:ArsR family transcriptional regulator|uniref:ArsR/SmtB family transcription factor n=1 Tax=Pseudomonas sp. TaxID=306 RepID=UPI002ED90587